MHIETSYLLNIGLRSSDGRCRITPGAVIHELYGVLDQSPVRVLKWTKYQLVGAEPTLVVELSAAPRWWSIFELASTLWQDCIACYDLSLEKGELVGPAAIKWGEFNPTLFLLPNGYPITHRVSVLPTLANEISAPVATAMGLTRSPTTKGMTISKGPYAGQPFTNPQPLPLSADTADFSDFGDCTKLATLGIFHNDASWFKAKRSEELADDLRTKGAYHWIGLSRHDELTRIRSEVADQLGNSGIWPTSSKLYTDQRRALDAHVLQQARKAGYTA